MPVHITPNILNENDFDKVIDDIVNNEDFEKSDTEMETFESIEKLKFPEVYYSSQSIFVILGDLNQNEMDNPRVQAMFKGTRLDNISIFILSQDYYELSKKTIRCNGNTYHIVKPNNFRDVQNLYQDKASMDMSLNDIIYLTYTCWDKKYQPLTIDMTKDK